MVVWHLLGARWPGPLAQSLTMLTGRTDRSSSDGTLSLLEVFSGPRFLADCLAYRNPLFVGQALLRVHLGEGYQLLSARVLHLQTSPHDTPP